MNPVAILLWSVPLLIVPASYCVCRFVPLRKMRYSLYALALVAAFFFNLFHITFLNETMDTVGFFAINFILAEFFWNCRRFAKGKFFAVLVTIALIVYGLEQWRWVAAGPSNAEKLWKPAVASTFHTGSSDYNLKDKDLFYYAQPARLLTLSKRIGSLPLEKQICTCPLPDGYYHATLTYKWSATGQGVRLDVWHIRDRLWTMGEGF